MSTFSNFDYHPETAASSNSYLRPPSSLSLSSNSGDSGFLPSSSLGSTSVSAANSRNGISSSGNTSIGSSPVPAERCIDQLLRKAVELLTLRSQALKQALASSQIDVAYFRSIPDHHEFTTDPLVNNVPSIERAQTQTNQLRSKNVPPISRKLPKPDSYKTVMCQAWLESGVCSFGENCRFAHGEEELRPSKLPTKNPKYKTKLCDKYTMVGLCPYGDRCLFIHPEASNAPNPYMRRDRYLKIQHERALLTSMNSVSSETPHLPLSGRATNRPPPSWPLESPAFFSAHRDLDQLLKMPLFVENSKPLSENSSPAVTLVTRDLDHKLALNDITNQTLVSVQATPNTTVSDAKLKINLIGYGSPDSGFSSAESLGSTPATDITRQTDSMISSDYPFQIAIHTDNLARSLACEFKVD